MTQPTHNSVDLPTGKYTLGWSDTQTGYTYKPAKGLNENIIRTMSEMKNEPKWMLNFRLKSYQKFLHKPVPQWGGGGLLNTIDFDDIYYYVKPADKQARSWDMVPESIKTTYEKLGIPEAERSYLAGVTAQYESEVVYHRNRDSLAESGVLFCDMDTAVKEHPELVQKHFGTVIPPNDNKYAALNSAVWSGGSFIYVPPGVKLEQPLQAYFRINSENMGQFERTLIIVDENAFCHYVEGCSAPVYTTDSLHAAVVEIVVKRGGRCRYTTIQNWSNNVYNLVTKRAAAYEAATMEWVDGNIGCLAEGTRVLTDRGYRPIEQLQPGDTVMSYHQQDHKFVWSPVTAVRNSGPQPVIQLKAGERRLKATGHHPIASIPHQKRATNPTELSYVRADQTHTVLLPTTVLPYGEPNGVTEQQAHQIGVAAAKQPEHGLPARVHTLPEQHRENVLAGYVSVAGNKNPDIGLWETRCEHTQLRQHLTLLLTGLGKTVTAEPDEAGHILRWPTKQNTPTGNTGLTPTGVTRENNGETTVTWDIEVAETGNFVAEGFLVHNSKLTMKYPAVWLMEPKAHGEVLSMAVAGDGQLQDTGAKMVHAAPETTSNIISKSVCRNGGRASYRGLVRVEPDATKSKAFVRCDALILDPDSRSDTYPYMELEESDIDIGHEATVSKIGEDQLFYLMSRGLTENEATTMLTAGFIEPIVKQLPMEYAVEMNRLVELNMSEAGAVG